MLIGVAGFSVILFKIGLFTVNNTQHLLACFGSLQVNRLRKAFLITHEKIGRILNFTSGWWPSIETRFIDQLPFIKKSLWKNDEKCHYRCLINRPRHPSYDLNRK